MMDPVSPPQVKHWSSFLKKMASILLWQHVILVALFGTHLDGNGNITDPEKEKITERLKTHCQIYDQMQWQTPVSPHLPFFSVQ